MERADVTTVLGAKLVPPRVQAIVRQRLDAALDRLWQHRLGLIVGPAGSGKTTLLSQFAARVGGPVVWYRADERDGSVRDLLACLERGAAAALPHIGRGWNGVGDAVAAFEGWHGDRGLLVVDDVHCLAGTAAEDALAHFVEDAPPSLAIVMASRRPPGFNVSRLRVSGALLEIGPDDLRFRSWEVEELFRECYREPMSPEDLAALARHTEGWAAGLQLFHLATQGKPARERQRVIRALGGGSRLVREYLARNVLAELPPELTRFLLGTCVLGRMTGALCDKLLDASGSDAVLDELERRQVFTVALDDGGVYRYHEVLRSYLEALLVERQGEAATRAWYRRAAELLELEEMLPEALRAYVRAEEWDDARALLYTRGEEVVEGAAGWIEGLPGGLVDHDPWLQLAAARRALSSGRLAAAMATYRDAEALFESSAGADTCRRERRAVATWLESVTPPAADWSGALRQATQRDPALVQQRAASLGPEHGGPLAAGLAALLAGNLRDAVRLLAAVAEAVESGPVAALGAGIGRLVASLLAGEPVDASAPERLARVGEQLSAPALAHLARAVLALTDAPQGMEAAERFRAYSLDNGDRWGAALALHLQGMGILRRPGDAAPAVDALDAAAAAFRALAAGVLEAWARAGAAVARARAGDPEARHSAFQAETVARAAGARGAQALAFAALGLLDGATAAEYRSLSAALAEDCGLSLAAVLGSVPGSAAGQAAPAPPAPPAAPPPPVALRCFGGFSLALFGEVVDCATVKPRARAALHVLAMRAPRPVHRDTLVDALWPGADAKMGARNLHVVVSSLRQLLEPGVARGASSLIVREGETYRLDLPAGAESDLLAFEAALAEGREAVAAGDRPRAAAAYRAALDLHRGDLLADDGSVDWVARARDECRTEAAAAAQALAEIELAEGDPEAAAAACDRGLRLDRYRDALWRLRAKASEAAGDVAESARIQGLYRDVLAELGIDVAAALR